MKILLAVVGWLFTLGGLVMFIMIVSDGAHRPDNAPTAGPSAMFVVAGAVFVLASVLVERIAPPKPPFNQGPGAPGNQPGNQQSGQWYGGPQR